MLESIYIVLIILAFVLTALSLFVKQERSEIKIVPFIAMILFAFAALGSANVETVTCDYVTDNTTATDWECHTSHTENVALISLFGGLAILMFVAGIIIATTESLTEVTRGQ